MASGRINTDFVGIQYGFLEKKGAEDHPCYLFFRNRSGSGIQFSRQVGGSHAINQLLKEGKLYMIVGSRIRQAGLEGVRVFFIPVGFPVSPLVALLCRQHEPGIF